MNRKFCILNVVTLCLSAIYSFIQFSTIIDISFIAMWLSLIFTLILVYYGFFSLQRKKEQKSYRIAGKLYEYLPFVLLTSFVLRRAGTFGTSYAFDVITVILWIIIAVLSYIISTRYLATKYFFKKNPEFSQEKQPNPVKKPLAKRIVSETIEWIDAFVQTVFVVVLINIFIFQLYEIPSESMVSQFLIGDRVLVFKISSGPKFPLTKVGLPNLKKYDRGDIAVFHNPHYPSTRQAEVKSFTSQLVFMLTLTLKNINVDEQGNPIADPLVKRVCGVPGEQLTMLDGKLYHRTQDSNTFTEVEEDNTWAKWNLNELPANIKQKVQTIPFSQNTYDRMLEAEENRRNFDVGAFYKECYNLNKEFSSIYNNWNGNNQSKYLDSDVKNLFSNDDMTIYSMFHNNEAITQTLLNSPMGKQWFSQFMTKWTEGLNQDVLDCKALYLGDMYSDSLFRINLMTKQILAKLIIQNARLMLNQTSRDFWTYDEIRMNCLEQADLLNLYMLINDSRNMMVFPSNDENGNATYIPQNCYFMMGDNRFNSLDMRHSYDKFTVPLMEKDEFSIVYESNLKPQYVSNKTMMGSPCLRFWPLNRLGIISKEK